MIDGAASARYPLALPFCAAAQKSIAQHVPIPMRTGRYRNQLPGSKSQIESCTASRKVNICYRGRSMGCRTMVLRCNNLNIPRLREVQKCVLRANGIICPQPIGNLWPRCSRTSNKVTERLKKDPFSRVLFRSVLSGGKCVGLFPVIFIPEYPEIDH